MQYELKILPQYFKAVQEGTKTFKITKNDRGFKVGDTLLLKEWECLERGYTGQEITKEVIYILEDGQCVLEEGYCILGLKEPFGIMGNCSRCESFPTGIILKNIDLTGISVREQEEKIREERQEFRESLLEYRNNKNKETKAHVIEEWWDRNQSELGLLEKSGISAAEVMAAYPLHEKKLLNRPRKKKCILCIHKADCRLYLSEQWEGQKEAESCKKYKEQEE